MINKAASGLPTINRISGGDKPDKRGDTFLPILPSWFAYQDHIPVFSLFFLTKH